jgi:hypothetical protein
VSHTPNSFSGSPTCGSFCQCCSKSTLGPSSGGISGMGLLPMLRNHKISRDITRKDECLCDLKV